MTATITPGGCSASSGTRGSHRRLEQPAHLVGGLLLARRVAEVHGGGGDIRRSRQVAGLGDVPAGSRSRLAVLSAAPAVSEMLYTRTSALAGRCRRDVGGGVEVVVTVGHRAIVVAGVVAAEPIAWNPTSRNTTPEEQQHHHHGAQGQPGGVCAGSSAHCIDGVRADPRKAQVTSKPSRRAARAFCRLARSRRSRLTSIGSAASASGRSTSALSTW